MAQGEHKPRPPWNPWLNQDEIREIRGLVIVIREIRGLVIVIGEIRGLVIVIGEIRG